MTAEELIRELRMVRGDTPVLIETLAPPYLLAPVHTYQQDGRLVVTTKEES